MSQLVIVFWNPNEETTKAATTLYLVDDDPKLESLRGAEGISISEFFKSHGVPIEKVMELFPGYIVPDTRTEDRVVEVVGPKEYVGYVFPRKVPEGPISWDYPLRWQRLPKEKEDMKRLSELLNMPISVFVFHRRTDKTPQFQYRVGE